MSGFRNEYLERRIKELEAVCTENRQDKDITIDDLQGCVPRLILMTQVFGKIIETIIREDHKTLDYQTLKNIFKEYCKISSELELDMLCRYCMDNPQNLKTVKIDGNKIIQRFNTLISNAVVFTEQDFNEMLEKIDQHPAKEHKNELFTIMQMFANKNGCTPDMLLSVIKGSKIDFNKK